MRKAEQDHKALQTLYGVTEGEKCGDCAHYRRYRQSVSWSKCAHARQSGGRGTDWRARWKACGLFVLDRETMLSRAGVRGRK